MRIVLLRKCKKLFKFYDSFQLHTSTYTSLMWVICGRPKSKQDNDKIAVAFNTKGNKTVNNLKGWKII